MRLVLLAMALIALMGAASADVIIIRLVDGAGADVDTSQELTEGTMVNLHLTRTSTDPTGSLTPGLQLEIAISSDTGDVVWPSSVTFTGTSAETVFYNVTIEADGVFEPVAETFTLTPVVPPGTAHTLDFQLGSVTFTIAADQQSHGSRFSRMTVEIAADEPNVVELYIINPDDLAFISEISAEEGQFVGLAIARNDTTLPVDVIIKPRSRSVAKYAEDYTVPLGLAVRIGAGLPYISNTVVLEKDDEFEINEQLYLGVVPSLGVAPSSQYSEVTITIINRKPDECVPGSPHCECPTDPSSGSTLPCVCQLGFRPTADGQSCEDIPECTENLHNCADAATCHEMDGSYQCECNLGFKGDGMQCVDIDECSTGLNDCDVYAECTNTAGSHTCKCRDGYEGSGYQCTDADECANGDARCGARVCVNTQGSFRCECLDGYKEVDDSCKEPGILPQALKDGTAQSAKQFFFNEEPSDYLFVAVLRKAFLKKPDFNIQSFCRRAKTCMYLNTKVSVPSNPTLEEKLEIGSNKDRRTAYFVFGRCSRSRSRRKLYNAVFNHLCFSARVLESTTGSFLPDMQTVFHAWTMQQMPVVQDGKVLIAFQTSHPNSDGLSIIGDSLMSGNRWNSNYGDRGVLMLDNRDDTSYDVVDWFQGKKTETTKNWDDPDLSVVDVIDNQLAGTPNCATECSTGVVGTECSCPCPEGKIGDNCDVDIGPCQDAALEGLCLNGGKPIETITSGDDCDCECATGWKGPRCKAPDA